MFGQIAEWGALVPLTDVAIRRAKACVTPAGKSTNKAYKMGDSGGLYLEVSPTGGRLWRFKYRFAGKEKRLALGIYPDVSLAMAREERDNARRLLAQDIDPSQHRKVQRATNIERASNTFESVGREWFAKYSANWVESHAEQVIHRLEKDVFPWLGSRPIADLLPIEVRLVIERIEKRGAIESAHKAFQTCGQIFRYGVATARLRSDPTPALRDSLAPAKRKNFASITDPDQVGALLRAIDGFKGTLVVQSALRLAPMLFVRPGELRKAKWEQFDLDKAEWSYVVSKTKTDHLVPLSTQAVAVLRDLRPLTGNRAHVFPGRDPKLPMSDAAINAALRRMGYDTKTEITGHGFRAMARTILHEQLRYVPEIIEHQLPHRVADPLGTAYNRTKFLKERKEMMQAWADFLDTLKSSSPCEKGTW